MKERIRFRFWLEIGAAVLTSALAIVTLIWDHWVEIVFGVSPDGGNGMFELSIVAGLTVATIILFVMARLEWQKSRMVIDNPSN